MEMTMAFWLDFMVALWLMWCSSVWEKTGHVTVDLIPLAAHFILASFYSVKNQVSSSHVSIASVLLRGAGGLSMLCN